MVETLRVEWDAFRRQRRDEPEIDFRPPEDLPEEFVRPEPPSYAALVPLLFGRYGNDHLPSHEERVREEQERLARRDQAHYGF